MNGAKPDPKRYYILILLTIVYAFNFIDRQIIGILAPYIQADLKLNDGQLGLLAGFYFALFYTFVGIPIAWLADRYNRVTIVSVCLALWSGFTAASGLAGNFLQLSLARMGVGIGEAGGSPPSHSMISDLFPKEERGKALGIYALGIPFGIMIAYFASALLLGQPSLDWRAVFIAVGIPGVLFAGFLKLNIKEPTRGAMDTVHANVTKVSVWTALKQLLTIPSWWGMCAGISLSSFGAYALSAFVIVFLVREYPEATTAANMPLLLIIFGLINGVAYGGGAFVGGMIADKWGRVTKGGYALTPAWGMLIASPCLILSFWVGNLPFALLLIAVYLFFSGFFLGPSFSVAQTLAPISVRAMSTAIFFFVLNLVALGGGPSYVGFVSDAFAKTYGELEGLRLAMTTLAVPYALSIIAFFLTARTLPGDWLKSEARNEGTAG